MFIPLTPRIARCLMLLLVLSGCGPGSDSAPRSHGGAVRDHVSLVDRLRADGYTVSPDGDVQQPFLRARGTVLQISGGNLSAPAELQSFNYDDTDLGADGVAAARTDATAIQPDGQPRNARVTWSGPPHFFHTERVIVPYVGGDQSLLRELQALLGPQFAGQ